MRRPLQGMAMFVILLAAPAAHAQQQVQFFASVVDSSGTPVTDLTLDDFLITEKGAEGKVLRVEPIDWPIRVAVMVDNGQSMGQWLANIRTGAKALLEVLPEGIEISLLTLAPQPRFMRRVTTDHQSLLEGIDRIAPDTGASMFVEALNEAAGRLQKEKGNYFPVVIIVGSTASGSREARERDVQRMLDRFSQRGATVHVVMLSTGGQGFQSSGANQIYVGTMVAKVTGGRYEQIAAPARLETLLPEIGAQVARSHALQSRQYRITALRPPGASGPLVDFGMFTRPGLTLILTTDGHMP